jgi:hypothetical protein
LLDGRAVLDRECIWTIVRSRGSLCHHDAYAKVLETVLVGPRFLLVPSFALLVVACFVIGVFLPFAAGPLVGSRFTTHVWYTYLIATLLTSHLLAAALLRAGLRLFPLRADLSIRRRVVAVSGWTFALTLALAGATASRFRHSTMDLIWGNPWPLVEFDGSVLLVLAAGRFLGLHQRVGRLSDRPFILFLRRFAGFSDRSVFVEILRAAPRGVPVYVVAGPMRDAAPWDPFLLCFHGMRVVRTISSSPVFGQTTDDAWTTAVARLVKSARCIVIDISDLSTPCGLKLTLQRPAMRVLLFGFVRLGVDPTSIPALPPESCITRRAGWQACQDSSLGSRSAASQLLWRFLECGERPYLWTMAIGR